jgi:hypothetical protein
MVSSLDFGFVFSGAGDDADFFGLPNHPAPVYISSKGGMHNISKDLVDDALASRLCVCKVHPGVRVARLEQIASTEKWCFHGVGDKAGKWRRFS